MSSSDFFVKLTDKYERQARLYPALLAGAPLLAVAIGIYGIPLEWAGLEFPWTPFWAKVVAGGVSDGKEEFWCE